MPRINQLQQLSIVPSLLVAGQLHVQVGMNFEDGTDRFTGPTRDVIVTDPELVERGRQLFADVANNVATREQLPVRIAEGGDAAAVIQAGPRALRTR